MAYIAEIGLYYARARTYSQYLGRFLQPDPSGYGPGMNLYGFAGNSPISRSDPFGLCDLGLGDDNGDCVTITVIGHKDPPPTPRTPEIDTPTLQPGFPGGIPLLPAIQAPAQSPKPPAQSPKPPAQSPKPPAQQPPPPPPPCYANRGNNPNVRRNIGVGALVGGVGYGVFAAVNIVGFPEVEVGEGIGVLLGKLCTGICARGI
jgi:RHS repeat-associated protein